MINVLNQTISAFQMAYIYTVSAVKVEAAGVRVMQESHFRIILGIALIIALYFDLYFMMLSLVVILSLEAVTNYRVPKIVSKLRYGSPQTPAGNSSSDCGGIWPCLLSTEAERMLRVVLIMILIPSYFIYFDFVWFLPWFLGFALIGSGLSGICPMVLALKRLGFS